MSMTTVAQTATAAPAKSSRRSSLELVTEHHHFRVITCVRHHRSVTVVDRPHISHVAHTEAMSLTLTAPASAFLRSSHVRSAYAPFCAGVLAGPARKEPDSGAEPGMVGGEDCSPGAPSTSALARHFPPRPRSSESPRSPLMPALDPDHTALDSGDTTRGYRRSCFSPGVCPKGSCPA